MSQFYQALECTGSMVLWRRLDTPGHDACRLLKSDAGWQLEGTAVFRHEGLPAQLSYRVACDPTWRTQRGEIRGWVGEQQVELTVVRADRGVWTLNGALVTGLEAYVDLDLGFTPATNLPQLRRVALAVGEGADVPVAWLDVSSWNLQVLPQRYERRTETTYWYESPTCLTQPCSKSLQPALSAGIQVCGKWNRTPLKNEEAARNSPDLRREVWVVRREVPLYVEEFAEYVEELISYIAMS